MYLTTSIKLTLKKSATGTLLALLFACTTPESSPDELRDRLSAFRNDVVRTAPHTTDEQGTAEVTEDDNGSENDELTVSDREIFKKLKQLSASISDRQLDIVAEYAMSAEGRPIAFALAYLLIERDRVLLAEPVIVRALEACPSADRNYRMGKWWETMLGERSDLEKLTAQMTLAMLDDHDRAEPDRKILIASIFGEESLSDRQRSSLRAEAERKLRR